MPTRKVGAEGAERAPPVLQWGRVVADAEGLYVYELPSDGTSFNGAASLPTRKVKHPSPTFCAAVLQWGRVVADAEGANRVRALVRAIWLQWGRVVADAEGAGSMGGTSTGQSELQWGRVVADAEGTKALGLLHKTIRLQWGRVVADAEGRPPGGVRDPFPGFNGAASLPTRKGPQ